MLLTQTVMKRPVHATTGTRWAAAVAAFGMLLRDAEHVGEFGWGDVDALARDARGDDPHGYRGEFLQLVGLAETLSGAGLSAHPPAPGLPNPSSGRTMKR